MGDAFHLSHSPKGVRTWTDDFRDHPHFKYRARVVDFDEEASVATLEFTASYDASPPSVDVGFWIVVGHPPDPRQRHAYVSRKEGVWPAGTRVLRVGNVSIWPEPEGYQKAPPGDTKSLFIITGSKSHPWSRQFMQRECVHFTKTTGDRKPVDAEIMKTTFSSGTKKKYTVFISSTQNDLVSERSRVSEIVLRSGHIPVAMEYFPATPVNSWSLITRLIDDCDYVICLVAARYGYVPDSEDKSYTEKE
jgi:hypothetical protein